MELNKHYVPPASLKPANEPYFEDVFDEFLSGSTVQDNAPFRFPRLQVLASAMCAFMRFVTGIFGHSLKQNYPVNFKPGAVWFYTTTVNQYHAISPVIIELEIPFIDLYGAQAQSIWGRSLAWKALACLPSAVASLLSRPLQELKVLANQVELLAVIQSESEAFIKYAKIYKPKALVISNDHSPRNRNILRAANALSIPVIYIQHAAVGGIERALNRFSAALLQGEHSLDIYKSLGEITAQVYLIGSPKIDSALSSQTSSKINGADEKPGRPHIGVFPGLFDEVSKAVELLETLSGALYANLSLKIHPRDDRIDEWRRAVSKLATLETLNESSSSEYLLGCDIAIFDDSNIGLEACALSVPVVRYPLKKFQTDQYQSLSVGIYDQCEATKDTVIERIQWAMSVKSTCKPEKIRYFFHNYQTPDYGRSHIKAAEIITDISKQ